MAVVGVRVVASRSAAQQNMLLSVWVSCMMSGVGSINGGKVALFNYLAGLTSWIGCVAFFFGRVMQNVAHCFFRRPLDIAWDGATYLLAVLGEFKHSIPCSYLLFSVP